MSLRDVTRIEGMKSEHITEDGSWTPRDYAVIPTYVKMLEPGVDPRLEGIVKLMPP